MNFCQSKLSFNPDESLIQTEHIFDNIPFADIATQQCNYIPSIQQILFTGKNWIEKRKMIFTDELNRLFSTCIEIGCTNKYSLFS